MKIFTQTYDLAKASPQRFWVAPHSQFAIGVKVLTDGQDTGGTVSLSANGEALQAEQDKIDGFTIFNVESGNPGSVEYTVVDSTKTSQPLKLIQVVTDSTVFEVGGSGASITVDAALSATSENPVQNKVVKAALDEKRSMDDLSYAGPGKPYFVEGDTGYGYFEVSCSDGTTETFTYNDNAGGWVGQESGNVIWDASWSTEDFNLEIYTESDMYDADFSLDKNYAATVNLNGKTYTIHGFTESELCPTVNIPPLITAQTYPAIVTGTVTQNTSAIDMFGVSKTRAIFNYDSTRYSGRIAIGLPPTSDNQYYDYTLLLTTGCSAPTGCFNPTGGNVTFLSDSDFWYELQINATNMFHFQSTGIANEWVVTKTVLN